jgi:hypothetical protein
LEQIRELARRGTRLSLKLPIRVLCKESNENEWTEQTRLIDVSPFGAGFTLNRPIEVGRLIQLTIPMPLKLRCFDHVEPLYSIWGLVRYASVLPRSPGQDLPQFRIGVAFTGKEPPLSYLENPMLTYEPLVISGGSETMWRLRPRPFVKQRRETRLIIPLEVLVEAIDENGYPAMQEQTVTETLSSLGTCIPTNLDVSVGGILKISCPQDQVSIYAVIRSRKVAADGIARLGVEFIGERWPLNRD